MKNKTINTNFENGIVGSWQLVPISIRIAFHNYEQILFLFFIPALISVLSFNYLGSSFDTAKISFTPHQMIGVYILSISLVISFINFPASIYFRVQTVKYNKNLTIATCYRKGYKLFVKVWLVEIVTYFLIIVGMIALIVPGVIFFRRYWLSPYYAVDNSNLSIKEILKKSASESKDQAYNIYATGGLVILISLFLSLIFGSSTIGMVFVYLLGYGILFLPVLRYSAMTPKKAKSN